MDAGTRLAYERTFLAHERTQLAWLRTALALISFGFTIAKVFEMLRDKPGDVGVAAPLMAPRTVGSLMISIGLAALVLASVQHQYALRRLRAACPDLPRSLAWITASLIALFGLAALASSLFRS